MKKKGKVHPSPPPSTQPPPSPPSSYLNEDESLSVLRLLPATILVLVSVLSTEDREVLAYLITRGNCGRISKKNKSSRNHHKPPVFDCECFDCYTNYWLRWDSSPNRELIHEIIEAFENHHLSTTTGGGENSKNKSKRGRKKEKQGRRVEPVSESHVSAPDNSLPGRLSDEADVVEREPRDVEEEVVVEESTVEIIPGAAGIGHKGLPRKVLPDVLGLLNSSFWRLWNPTNA